MRSIVYTSETGTFFLKTLLADTEIKDILSLIRLEL